MNTPSKAQYQNALEMVKTFEKRQSELSKLNKDLGSCLKRSFDKFTFNVDRKKGEVVFAGITKDGDLKLTKSTSKDNSKFDDVIGKLICVKKAVGEDVAYIYDYIEEKKYGLMAEGLIAHQPMYMGRVANSR